MNPGAASRAWARPPTRPGALGLAGHASLGTRLGRGWAEAFAPFAAGGRRPARVVAVHRETSVVRDGVSGIGPDRVVIGAVPP